MSQQINLVNIALIKQKPLITLNSMTATLVAIVIVMLGYYAYLQKEVSALKIQRQEIANNLTNTQNEIKALALSHAPQEKDLSLEKQIALLEQKIKVQQQILTTLSHSTNTPGNSYAGLMRAFARQNIDGLWLTGFSVDSQTDTINIQGKALQSDLVPQYINRLSNEAALKGKLFSGLNINLPKAETVVNNVAAVDAPHQTQPGKTATALTKPNTKTSTTSLPNYIEFNLESKLDTSASPTANSSSNTANQTPVTGGKS